MVCGSASRRPKVMYGAWPGTLWVSDQYLVSGASALVLGARSLGLYLFQYLWWCGFPCWLWGVPMIPKQDPAG